MTGTRIVDLVSVKKTLTHKDYLLFLGVLVAVIIGATVFWNNNSNKEQSKQNAKTPKAAIETPSVSIKKLLRSGI